MPNNIAILDLKFNFYSKSRKEQLVPFSLPWVYSSIRLLILVHQTTYKYQNCEYCHWKINLQIMNHLSIEIYLNLIFYLLHTNHNIKRYQSILLGQNLLYYHWPNHLCILFHQSVSNDQSHSPYYPSISLRKYFHLNVFTYLFHIVIHFTIHQYRQIHL